MRTISTKRKPPLVKYAPRLAASLSRKLKGGIDGQENEGDLQKLRIVEPNRVAYFDVNLRLGGHLIGQPLQHPPFHQAARHLVIANALRMFSALFTVFSPFDGRAVDAGHIEKALEVAPIFWIDYHHRPVPTRVHRLHIHQLQGQVNLVRTLPRPF